MQTIDPEDAGHLEFRVLVFAFRLPATAMSNPSWTGFSSNAGLWIFAMED
jgi:hypothetical protein